MPNRERIGILLINLGTPEAPTYRAVASFTRSLLLDGRVVDVSSPARHLIANASALFRTRSAIRLYRAIWDGEAFPLQTISRNTLEGLRERLAGAEVAMGMRHGRPTIQDGIETLMSKGAGRIVLAPLFPQYAASTTGSTLAEAYRCAGSGWNVPPVSVLRPFYDSALFVRAWKEIARPVIEERKPDYVVFSYHSVPEQHIRKSDPTGRHCLAKPDCCETAGAVNLPYCYRAQCLATTRAIAGELSLPEDNYCTSFQSRMSSPIAWLRPYTTDVLRQCAAGGQKRVMVLCPSFVVDCLETLVEIDIVERRHFLASGGAELLLLPCLNAHPRWLDGLAEMLRAC